MLREVINLKIKTKDIIKEAIEIKNFIETNKKLPNYCTINKNKYDIYATSYLITRAIMNLKSDTINLKKITKSNQGFSAKLSENCSKSTYIDMIQRFNDYCSKHERIPSYVITIKNKADFTTFLYSCCKILNYYHNNKSLPGTCLFSSSYVDVSRKTAQKNKTSTAKSTSTTKKVVETIIKAVTRFVSKPHLLTTQAGLGQNYPWDCSCAALQQAIYKLTGIKIPEETLIKITGCTTKGVGHDGINTAIAWVNKTYKTNLKVEWKTFTSMGKTDDERFKAIGELISKSNIGLIWHILYVNGGDNTNASKNGSCGHYEVIDIINTSTKYVRALNSLGKKINAHAYAGHLQDRKFAVQSYFARNTPGGQAALCIISKK